MALRCLRATLLLATFGFLAQLTTAAHAMNFYNNTTVQLSVDFSCGIFCGNNWTVNAGDMKSRPNEAGNLWALGGNYACSVDVDQHGWVVAAGSDDTSIVLTSYHQDGSVRQTCTFVNQGF